MGSLARLARRAVETDMPVMVQVGLILLEVLYLLVDASLFGSFFFLLYWDLGLEFESFGACDVDSGADPGS